MGARGSTANLSQRQATPWQPQRRLAGGRTPVTVSSSVLFIPCPQPGWSCSFLFALLSVRFLHSESQRGSAHFPTPHISLVCSPTPHGGPIWCPRFRVASPSPVPPVRLPPRPGPRLLIVQTQFSSLWLRPRVASGRPEPPPPNLEWERPGGARAGPPDTRDPAAALGAQGARPAAEVQLRPAFPGIPGTGLGEAGDHRTRRGGELRPRVPHVHAQHPHPQAGSVRASRGRGNPVPRHPPRAPRGR